MSGRLQAGVANDVVIGENVTIIDPVNLYGCRLEHNTFVGPFVEIQKGVSIGENTRVSSHCFICSGVTIGRDCFLGHGIMFTNDLLNDWANERSVDNAWPPRPTHKPTVIGDRVRIGSNATLLPVTVGDDAIIGAGAVVTKDVAAGTTVVGNPARRL